MSIVLLLSRQRSGSGALASVLERQPAMFYCGEILDPSNEVLCFYEWMKTNGSSVKNTDDLCLNFSTFISSLLDDEKINIIDLKYNCLSNFSPPFHPFSGVPWVLEFLSKIPIPMIHLKRNAVDCFISAKLAEMSNVFHTTEKSEINFSKVNINIDEIAEFLSFSHREDMFMSEFFRNYKFSIELDYDSAFRDHNLTSEALAAIGGLLDVDFSAVDPEPRFHKQSAWARADRVENFPELDAFVRGYTLALAS